MATVKKRKKDRRTIRKEMKSIGFSSLKFSTWGHHHEKFVIPNPELYTEKFIQGTDRDKCDFAKAYIFEATDGLWCEEDLLAFELDGIKCLEFSKGKWIDGSERKFNPFKTCLKWEQQQKRK